MLFRIAIIYAYTFTIIKYKNSSSLTGVAFYLESNTISKSIKVGLNVCFILMKYKLISISKITYQSFLSKMLTFQNLCGIMIISIIRYVIFDIKNKSMDTGFDKKS